MMKGSNSNSCWKGAGQTLKGQSIWTTFQLDISRRKFMRGWNIELPKHVSNASITVLDKGLVAASFAVLIFWSVTLNCSRLCRSTRALVCCKKKRAPGKKENFKNNGFWVQLWFSQYYFLQSMFTATAPVNSFSTRKTPIAYCNIMILICSTSIQTVFKNIPFCHLISYLLIFFFKSRIEIETDCSLCFMEVD